MLDQWLIPADHVPLVCEDCITKLFKVVENIVSSLVPLQSGTAASE